MKIRLLPFKGNNWKQLTEKAEVERKILYEHLDGKALFTGVLRLYGAIHRELQ
jgi:hypothetical protein